MVRLRPSLLAYVFLVPFFVVAAPAAMAECERVANQWITVEEGCSGTSSGGSDKGGFWTGPVAQTVYAVLGLGATGAAGFFTTQRIRRRRRELRVFLNDVEAVYAQAKSDPDAGLPKLEGLRRGLASSHNQGRLDDPQFLEMDRRLREYITRVRLLQLERAFPTLPMAMFSEIRAVLSDGQLSPADLALVEKRAVQLDVPAGQRTDLLVHLRRWAPGAAAPAAAPRRRLAVVAR